jgi:nitrate reductase cytochrome c-type subunit
MNRQNASIGQGVLIINGFIVLAVAVAGIVESRSAAPGGHGPDETIPHLVAADLMNADHVPVSMEMAMATPKAGVKERTLHDFYSLRAYPGAPPMIPHDVAVDGVMADDCLSCHQDGGLTPKYNAYAPISPHPEKENCRQCHLPAVAKLLFASTGWVKPNPPKLGRSMLPGSPHPIPHTLQLRENCQACHTGPAAVKEIRVSHPERENCVQCHVPNLTLGLFKTPYPVEGKPNATK